jgi:hypothetical protein
LPVNSAQALQWNKAWLDDWNLAVDRAALKTEAQFGTKPGLLGMIGRTTLMGGQYVAAKQGSLISHEQEHLRMGLSQGRKSYIDHIGFLEGLTITEGPWGGAGRFAVSAAGLNASERHGEDVWARAAGRRALTLRDALAHFASALDDTTYAGAILKGPEALNRQGSDFLNMRNMLNQAGHEISLEEMYAKSLLVDLLSPSSWYALCASINYVVSGDREIAVRPWGIGGLRFTPPHLGMQRHLSHDTIRFHTTFMPEGAQPLRLRVDLVTSPGRKSYEAIGGRLQATKAAQILPRTYLAPYLGRRNPGPGGSGWEYGTDLWTDLDGIQLSGNIGYSDFSDNPGPGWLASLQVRFSF